MNLMAFGQFEFKEIISTTGVTALCNAEHEIYVFDRLAKRVNIIDKVTGQIEVFDHTHGYRMMDDRGTFLLDSFVVVVTTDQMVSQFDGYLSMNITTHEFWLDSIKNQDYLVGYTYGITSCSDGNYVYSVMNVNSTPERMMFKYRPESTYDTLLLDDIGFFPSETINKLAKRDSLFCALTSYNRFLIWPENDPASYISIDANRDYIDGISAANGCFLYSGSNSDESQDSIYMIDHNHQIQNLSQAFGLTSFTSTQKVRFHADSLLFISYQGLHVYDTTTTLHSIVGQSYYDFPWDIGEYVIDDEKIYLGSGTGLNNTSRHILFTLNSAGTIDSIAVDPFDPASHCHYSSGSSWSAGNGDFVSLGMDHVVYYRDGNYVQKPLTDPFLSTLISEPFFSQGNYYHFMDFEDSLGNIYGRLTMNYYTGNPGDDTTFYIMLTPDYEDYYLSKGQYELLTQQKTAMTAVAEYAVLYGNLKQTINGEINMYAHPPASLLTRVFVSDGVVYCSGENHAFRFDPVSGEFESLADIPVYPYAVMSNFSSDRMGNVYFSHGNEFYKVDPLTGQTTQLNKLDSLVNNTTPLTHDKNGNVYGIAPLAIGSATGSYLIPYFNGFEWYFPSDDGAYLGWGPEWYMLTANPLSDQVFFQEIQNLSRVQVTCPCRELTEIKDEYWIYDSSDVRNIQILPDMVHVMWSDGTMSNSFAGDTTGRFWVKAANAQGCTTVKEFAIHLKPTVNHNYEDLFYYFGSNTFPLTLEQSLVNKNLKIYDLKGSLVYDWMNYQNNWIPGIELSGSIMVYGVYDQSDKLLRSGRLIFL